MYGATLSIDQGSNYDKDAGKSPTEFMLLLMEGTLCVC